MEATTCGFCRAPLATQRCAACYHMNAFSSLNCTGCGHELGLVPVAEQCSIPCPSCSDDTPRTLCKFKDGAHYLYDCQRCGGQFAPHALVLELARRTTRLSRVPTSPTDTPNAVRYLACPTCNVLMNRKNFGGNSGIVVDVCAAHGVWFDRGELPKVIAYIEADGLVALRRHALGVTSKPFEVDAAQRIALCLQEQRSKAGRPSTKDVVFGVLEGSLDVLNLAGRWLKSDL